MKKIFAKQLDCECFDYRAYYDEDMAVEDQVYIGGNRNFCGFNEDLRASVVKAFEECRYDLETVDSDVDDGEMTDEEGNAQRLDLCKNYFEGLKGKEVKFSDEQYFKLGSLSREFWTCRSSDENDLVCEALSILHNKEFVNGTIRGCCQGDWNKYICPKERQDFVTGYVKAVYFATGTEFQITCEPIEVDSDDVDEIESKFEEAEVYCDYTDLWKDDDIKEWIAKNSSYGDKQYTKDDVALITIKSSRMVKVNSYELK